MKALALAATLCTLALGVFLYAWRPAEGDTMPGPAAPAWLRGLDRDNFYTRIVPQAQREGQLTIYSFAAGFVPLWEKKVIPAFERRYGIPVRFFQTRADLADQQLVALHGLKRDAPADVYFAPGGHLPFYRQARLAANIRLADVLPEAAALSNEAPGLIGADARFVPFHFNQAAFAFDGARLPEAQMPYTFEALLQWAQRHPRQFAFTAPDTGGSGAGFLIALAYRFMPARCVPALLDDSLSAAAARRWVETSGCFERTWDYLRALTKVASITKGNADTQMLLANHGAMIGTVWEDWVFSYVKAKLLPPTVRLVVPTSGMPSAADVLFIPERASHPAAAMLFIDFAMSWPVQHDKWQSMASRSGRADMRRDGIAPARAGGLVLSPVPARAPLRWPPPAMMAALTGAFADRMLEWQ